MEKEQKKKKKKKWQKLKTQLGYHKKDEAK